MCDQTDSKISYKDAINYWSKVEPTVKGVLGGYGEGTSVPRADIIGSMTFYRRLHARMPKNISEEPTYALDFGAGIGRVTKSFLSKVCDRVDLLEPVGSFVDQMRIELLELAKSGKIGSIYQISMQDWIPEREYSYQILWCQWCCGHLPDRAFIHWLNNCKKGLKEGGYLVVKENLSTAFGGEDIFDPTDSSKTRSDSSFRKLFSQAGWDVVLTMRQHGMPHELYPIQMYALQPSKD